jgi:hypothetical protein
MIARWEKGRSAVDALIADRRLERVSADRNLANMYVGISRLRNS